MGMGALLIYHSHSTKLGILFGSYITTMSVFTCARVPWLGLGF